MHVTSEHRHSQSYSVQPQGCYNSRSNKVAHLFAPKDLTAERRHVQYYYCCYSIHTAAEIHTNTQHYTRLNRNVAQFVLSDLAFETTVSVLRRALRWWFIWWLYCRMLLWIQFHPLCGRRGVSRISTWSSSGSAPLHCLLLSRGNNVGQGRYS